MSATAPDTVGVGVGTLDGVGDGVGVGPVGVGVGVGPVGVIVGITPVGLDDTPVAVPPPLHDARATLAKKAPIPMYRRLTRIGCHCRQALMPFLLGLVWYYSVEGGCCMLIQVLGRNWWLLLLRGILAIAFAIVAFADPGIALFWLVFAFGLWAALDGIFAFGAAFGP